MTFDNVQFTTRPLPKFDVPDYQETTILLSAIDDLLFIQCSPGTWNANPYMHGLANGMRLIRSIISGEDPAFLSAPDRWLDEEWNSCSANNRNQGGNRGVFGSALVSCVKDAQKKLTKHLKEKYPHEDYYLISEELPLDELIPTVMLRYGPKNNSGPKGNGKRGPQNGKRKAAFNKILYHASPFKLTSIKSNSFWATDPEDAILFGLEKGPTYLHLISLPYKFLEKDFIYAGIIDEDLGGKNKMYKNKENITPDYVEHITHKDFFGEEPKWLKKAAVEEDVISLYWDYEADSWIAQLENDVPHPIKGDRYESEDTLKSMARATLLVKRPDRVDENTPVIITGRPPVVGRTKIMRRNATVVDWYASGINDDFTNEEEAKEALKDTLLWLLKEYVPENLKWSLGERTVLSPTTIELTAPEGDWSYRYEDPVPDQPTWEYWNASGEFVVYNTSGEPLGKGTYNALVIADKGTEGKIGTLMEVGIFNWWPRRTVAPRGAKTKKRRRRRTTTAGRLHKERTAALRPREKKVVDDFIEGLPNDKGNILWTDGDVLMLLGLGGVMIARAEDEDYINAIDGYATNLEHSIVRYLKKKVPPRWWRQTLPYGTSPGKATGYLFKNERTSSKRRKADLEDYIEFDVPFSCLCEFYGVHPDEFKWDRDFWVLIYKDEEGWHASNEEGTLTDLEWAPQSDKQAEKLAFYCSTLDLVPTTASSNKKQRKANQLYAPKAYKDTHLDTAFGIRQLMSKLVEEAVAMGAIKDPGNDIIFEWNKPIADLMETVDRHVTFDIYDPETGKR